MVVHSPRTAAEVLEYLHVILPKSSNSVPSYIFNSAKWANKYCDFDVDLDRVIEKYKAEKIGTELVLLCAAIVDVSRTPKEVGDSLSELYSRSYSKPDDDRTMKETGPIFDGVPVSAIEFAAVTNTIQEFGAQILQAPYWVFDALSIRYTHDLKRERAQRQKASDIEETKRINAEVFK